VRTLSATHAAYNPHDYQLGAIWPHDNGMIAVGLKRYGFHEYAARIAGGLIDAGSRFMLSRMPEVFAGTSRAEAPFPIQYLGANVPQAWAAGSILSLLRSLIGIEIDPGAAIIFADPTLPGWLGELRLEHVRVGDRTVDLRVWRDGDASRIEIVGGDADVSLVRRTFTDAYHDD
jgi:glycogen debranching enzyme